MFYSDFADDYEEIFPYRETIFSFLNNFIQTEKARILDIGCGTGHYCGKFADLEHDVTGIDLDKEMIRTAEKKYSQAAFSVLNLTDINVLKSRFNIVYSTGNVMSHINERDLGEFLTALKGILKPESIWIFQVINWDYILELNEFTFPVIETEMRRFIRNYKEINEADLIFHTELQNKSDNSTVFKDSVKMYPLRSEKYISLHESKGFNLIGHYSDFSNSPIIEDTLSAEIYVFTN